MEYITPVLASLHWLPAKIRVDFKVFVFVFKALHGLAQINISDLLHFYFHSPFDFSEVIDCPKILFKI